MGEYHTPALEGDELVPFPSSTKEAETDYLDAAIIAVLQDYHAFPSEMQTRIFMPAPPSKRKVVIVDFRGGSTMVRLSSNEPPFVALRIPYTCFQHQ